MYVTAKSRDGFRRRRSWRSGYRSRRCAGLRRHSGSGRHSITKSHLRSGRRTVFRGRSMDRGVELIKREIEGMQKKLMEMSTTLFQYLFKCVTDNSRI